MPRDELADALWGAEPPATWDKALTVVVSKLRALLAEVDGEAALTSAFGCYRLELPPETWIDVVAAADAAAEAEAALTAGELDRAKERAERAAALAGESFLPGEDGDWVEGERRRLADVRDRALGTLADACLRSGDGPEAAKWAEQTIASAPFRESGYRRLMEAHIAAGNRAEALRVYERCRQLLAEELGTYPSPETERIYRGLLEAPVVQPKPAPPDGADDPGPMGVASRRRRRMVVVGVGVAAASAVFGAIVATRSGGVHAVVGVNRIVALEPSGAISGSISVGARPVSIASDGRTLWVANLDDQSVTRVDTSSRQALGTISVGTAPTGVAVTGSTVWVSDKLGRVSRIDARYDQLVDRLPAAGFAFFNGEGLEGLVLAAFGSLWIVHPDGYISRANADTGEATGSASVGNEPSAIAAGAGSIWVTNSDDGTVTRIDPSTLVTTTIPVGHGPSAVAVNAVGVWIANAGDNTLVRVDPDTNVVVGTTRVGNGPAAVLATSRALWVANAEDGTVMRLDPRSGNVEASKQLGGTPDALAAAGGRVWVALAAAPPPAAVGGSARLTLQSDRPSWDPALAESPPLLYATCANLVTYGDEAAPKGSRIVPEVAAAVPVPIDGGTTYTFTIRPGFRFSPPSNAPVTAATFKSTIERVVNPRMKSVLASQFGEIVGYHAYVTGRAKHLAGLIVHGRTLAIRLSQPDGGFLANLASGAACAVPLGTPAVTGGIDDIPSAGPYYIASYTPRQQLVLRRNPNYHGDRPHRLDQIVFAIGIESSRALREVESGQADYAFDGVPRGAGPRLQRQYGPGSRAAKAGHQQYFVNTADAVRYLHMNTSRPLFSNVRLRRAVNYAIDRTALVAQGRRFAEVNPFNAGAPTDDYLPPSMAGARDFRIYPLRPDLAKAKRLAGHIHATAIMYTPNVPPWLQEAQIIRSDLKRIGIDVQVREFPLGDFFTRIGRRGEPFDLAVSGWSFPNTDPSAALSIFDGSTIHAGANANFSYFTDPAFDRQLRAAAKLSGSRRYRVYTRLAVELGREAPAAPFATNASRDFFSARIGCQLYQPVYGIDLAALCLRR